MCWHGGVMALEEYRKEICDIQTLMFARFKREEKDAVYQIRLCFRDEIDCLIYGTRNRVVKHFSSVEKFVHIQNRLYFDEEYTEDKCYWRVEKYVLSNDEYQAQMQCDFSLDMELLSVGFLSEKHLTSEEYNHKYLFTWPKNIEVPYQTGDILKIHAAPFGKDFYVIYGGERKKGERAEGLEKNWDCIQHWCIYESEDRNGLWNDDLADDGFTDYICFPHSPLINCEKVEYCPDPALMKLSRKLKEDPELWFCLVDWCEQNKEDYDAKIEDCVFYKIVQQCL